ncbi:MAG: tetratricopeptide (TPR) repeat protein [Bradymonadia bacterium]|jgi:tetratricopeptide (TPR) repeat protein
MSMDQQLYHNQFEAGRAFGGVGQWARARQAYAEALQAKPNDPRAAAMIAECLRHEGKVSAAIDAARVALSYDAQNTLALEVYALCLLSANHNIEALEVMTQLLARDPHRAHVHRHIAIVYRYMGDFSTELEALMNARRLDPSDPITLGRIGEYYRIHGDFDTAERWLRDALELDPRNPEALAGMGWLFIEQNNPEEAIQHARWLLDSRPHSQAALALQSAARLRSMPLIGHFWAIVDSNAAQGSQNNKLVGAWIGTMVASVIATASGAPPVVMVIVFTAWTALLATIGVARFLLDRYRRVQQDPIRLQRSY